MYSIDWKESAIKELEKLDRSISSRVFKNVEELKEGLVKKDVKRLQRSTYFRLRVGDYRIIFSLEDNTITILKMGHRKNIYKR